MIIQIVTTLANVAFLVLVGYVVFKAVSRVRGKALPDLPPEGGRIRTAELKTFARGKSAHFGFGNRQRLGYVELTPDRLRTGRFIAFDSCIRRDRVRANASFWPVDPGSA